jgi:hypothetical protein
MTDKTALSSTVENPLNVLVVANAIGTVGIGYWGYTAIRRLTKSVEDLNEEVKKITSENNQRNMNMNLIQSNLNKIGIDLKEITQMLDGCDMGILPDRLETLEEEAKDKNPDFHPFSRRKRNRGGKKGKRGKKNRKYDSSSDSSSDSSEDDDLVMKASSSKRGKRASK